MANKAAMTVFLSEDVKAELNRIKEQDGIPIQNLVERSVTDYLEKLHREGYKVSDKGTE